MYVMTLFILFCQHVCHDEKKDVYYILRNDIGVNMEKERYTFRLSQETIDKLDELQAEGIIKNRTDGVIKAIDRLYVEEDNRENPFLRLLSNITHTSRISDSWEFLDKDASVLIIHDESGEEDLVMKLGDNSAKVVRNVEGKRIAITIESEDETITISPSEYVPEEKNK